MLRICSHNNDSNTLFNTQTWEVARPHFKFASSCDQPLDSHYRSPGADRPTTPPPHTHTTTTTTKNNNNNNETFAEQGSAGSHEGNLPHLFAPVKCARALMNWHRFIPLPLRRYCHYAPSHRFTLPPTLFTLQQCCSEGPLNPQHPPSNTHKAPNNEKPLAE